MKQQEFIRHDSAVAGITVIGADSAQHFSRHTHDEFGIGVIRRGAQSSASGRGPVEAGPLDVITVNPGEVHDGRPIGDGGRSWQMLYFQPQSIAEVVADVTGASIDTAEFQSPVLRDPVLARRMLLLFDLLRSRQADPLQLEEALLCLLAGLLRPAEPRERSLPPQLVRAKAMIDEDPSALLTLADLARAADLSRFQLVRGFSRLLGLPPHAYLKQRRVQRARRLIEAGMPLAEAAYASGFCDQSHMTRAFTRSLGLTPGAFAPLMEARD